MRAENKESWIWHKNAAYTPITPVYNCFRIVEYSILRGEYIPVNYFILICKTVSQNNKSD